MNDPDQTITWSLGEELPGRVWADDTPVNEERPGHDLTGGLVNLGFFTAALRRSAWVWCLTAVLGLLLGSALYVKYPPAYHATTTVLLVDNANQDPAVEVQTDQSLAQSQAVAARVVRTLKLPQSVASFQAAYTVTIVTSTVLTINVGAPSSAAAVQRASALATAFLQYRAQYAQNQQQQLFAQLDEQNNAAQQRLNVLEAQLSQTPNTPTGEGRLRPPADPAGPAEADHPVRDRYQGGGQDEHERHGDRQLRDQRRYRRSRTRTSRAWGSTWSAVFSAAWWSA